MDVDTAAIRRFITRYFDDNELNYFCADYFREIYEDFSTGMSKRQKVHNLVEYCYRHGRVPDLLVALEQERASLYHNYFFAWVEGDELLEDVKYADYDFDPSFESVFEEIQRRMVMFFLALLLIVTLFALFVLPELVAQ